MTDSFSMRDGRRLSPFRLILGIVLTVAVGGGVFFGVQSWASAQPEISTQPWFAGYVDVTATPSFEFEDPSVTGVKDAVLSFIVADPDNGCSPSWGGAYSLDEAATTLDLDRRIVRLRQQGGAVAVSFGGALGDELGTSCSDTDELAAAYTSVLERYDVSTIDLDVEGDNLANAAAGARRATAIAAVQAQRTKDGEPLAVWLTLPVATSGLTQPGTTAITQMLAAGVDLAGVNLMTMDFGGSRDSGESMADASERSLTAAHDQISTLYARAGIQLSGATIWAKMAATPMLGQNDVKGEVFTLDDAAQLNTFATGHAMGRVSVWSLNRDKSCGANYVTLERVSDACSGIDQGTATFTAALGAGIGGLTATAVDNAAAALATTESVDPDDTDNPRTSPYPVWSEDASYAKSAEVVWHHNVYEAKWWTQGDLPDDAVSTEWETAWTLIGPVLAGEKPYQLGTLAYGIYPDWSGTETYLKAARVTFDGVAFEARWWTQADSPGAYASDPASSPWVPLTQEQIDQATP